MIELSKSEIDDLRHLNRLCAQLKAEFAIIGAIAYKIHFPDEERHTIDIDFAVALELADFAELCARLKESGWTQTPKQEQRWRSTRGTLLDLIPAGKELRESKQVTWPKSELTMSLVGFDHVFSEAQPVEFADGLALPVIPPVVLMLLKIVAFMDNPHAREKDLSDIRALLSQYEADSDRIFSEAVLNAGVTDYRLANAFLLGCDLRTLCTADELALVREFVSFVSNETKPAWRAFVRAAPRPTERNEDTAQEQLRTFSAGFQ